MTTVNAPAPDRRSLALAKFRKALEAEIRVFWHVLASLEYSARWWKSVSPLPSYLSKYAGDNRVPFTSIDVPVYEYISDGKRVRAFIRENAVVSFVTALEFYLFELLERMIYIDPTLILDSSIPIEAKEIAAVIPSADLRRWLATKVADHYLRNKSHAEMISKIDRLARAGVTSRLRSEIQEWSKWSFVRNAVVHTSRFVTGDLARAWQERFSQIGSKLELTDREVARVHFLALKIAKEIDRRAVESTIGTRDALLFVRELFVQRGIEDATVIRRETIRILATRLSRSDVQQAIAQQRKGTFVDSWTLDNGELDNIVGTV